MTLDLDRDVANADWTKRYSWDIPASNPAELYAYLAQRGIAVADFKKLPVFQANESALPWLAGIEQPQSKLSP